MTAAAASVPSPRGVPLLIQRHWRLVGFLLCSLVPFAPSLYAMRSFLLADNALGFVPLLLPAAACVFAIRARSARPPSKSDILLDSFFFVPTIGLALFVLMLTPARLSWYFWLYRMDLLAFGLVTLAAGFVFFGYQQVIRTWQAFALLLLVWPYPIVRLQQVLGGPMQSATVWVSHRVTEFLALPYEVAGNTFTTTLDGGENFYIILDQSCSGSALTIGFLLVGLVLTLLMRGPFMRRVYWLLLGSVLAYVSNWLRTSVLLAVAARVDYDLAFEVVHPMLGLLLFAVLTFVMLLLVRPFGLRLDFRGEGGQYVVWQPTEGGGKPLKLAFVTIAGLAALFGVLSTQAQQYSFIGTGEGAPAVDVTSIEAILPQVEGWSLAHDQELVWTDLFGAGARGDLFIYSFPDGPRVVAQVLVVEQRSDLARYPIEQCILFHRREIEAREFVSIGHGVTGVIVHDTYQDTPGTFLYWEQPVRVAGETRHARIALILDISEAPKTVNTAALPGASSLAERFGVDLTTKFDGRARPGDDPRVGVDLTLVELGSQVLDAMVRTGGPAASGTAAGG